MNYTELLITSAEAAGNCACIGLDPVLEALPRSEQSEKARPGVRAAVFFEIMLEAFAEMRLIPAAFKPNLGYFTALDRPREGHFDGSMALTEVLSHLAQHFPGVPVILDAKRGDIARSSENYAIEAFDAWGADALTVSPYMGQDSVAPFRRPGKGVYLLCRTSNPGAADFQTSGAGTPLYLTVAEKIAAWTEEERPLGAVAGATGPAELSALAALFAGKNVPLLIPGVGSQGGSAGQTLTLLQQAKYDVRLSRVNSSGAITRPWKGPSPADWLKRILEATHTFLQSTTLRPPR